MQRLLLIVIAITQCQCSGVGGTVYYRVNANNQFRKTEIYSYGIEIANHPQRRGLTLGSRKTIIIQKNDSLPSQQSQLKYGYYPTYEGKILNVSSLVHGFEISADPTFVGVSAGINSRSISSLPPNEEEFFYLNLNTQSPTQTIIQPMIP